ncbi:MAG: hypothetical protein CBARDCOR_2500 [uncultured Caballeronia sp.]|nr:MAG: hypothetical protein CBARDCOR_2500 [uncultured Caballeronia sp.]
MLAAIARWPNAVKLTGVELYGRRADESKVRAFLQNAVDVTRACRRGQDRTQAGDSLGRGIGVLRRCCR